MNKTMDLQKTASAVFARTPVTDIHTHLFDPAMGPLLLWGIDELLTYHYLVAEVLRARPELGTKTFWAMPKAKQADLVWQELFVKRSPVSEACRGVLTVLKALGLDAPKEDLTKLRKYFRAQKLSSHVERVLQLAGVKCVYMTNDPLNPSEQAAWEKGFARSGRFLAALRLESAIKDWPQGAGALKALGYAVDSSLSGRTLREVRRYLNDWVRRMKARYLSTTLPPEWRYPDIHSSITNLLVKAVIPTARERGLPVALMIGVRKAVNPALGDAGDSVGLADLAALERLALGFSDVTFLVTVLARENLHGLCVAARKFKNIVPFGCWWFLNTTSFIGEITAMRLDLIGLSFIPQHSDSRVLEQLIYKWGHSRCVIAEALAQKYADLAHSAWPVTEANIRRDVAALFDGRLINQRTSIS
ncbi:MAG: glucuronate isomerase [Lentisphaerae bacterium]|nr:glucuronate isomerase [Lentisphaerota bacterium]